MSQSFRLDKYLCLQGEISRSEAGAAIRSGRVTVEGNVVRDPGHKVSPENRVTLDACPVNNEEMQYVLLNKPSGILTAARSKQVQTVMDLLPPAFLKKGVMPVGRLDKDTTGLLLFTNDGALGHLLLSPKRHVWKKYLARVTGRLEEKDRLAFEEGIQLKDFKTAPARMEILSPGEEESLAAVWLREGKFHQVKRMFSALGHEVTALHRESFGPLVLPEDLKPGEWRKLQKEEIAALQEAAAGNGEQE